MDMQSPLGLPLALRLLSEKGIPAPSAWKRLAEELEGQRDSSAWREAALARWREAEPPCLDRADPDQRWIALLADTFRQWLELGVLARRPGSRPWELRDRFMAENAVAQTERFGADARAMTWAHNGHVAFGGDSDGTYLRAALGTAYRSVGFAFGRGRISAGTEGPDGRADWELRAHSTHPPPPGSMERLLDGLDLPCYAIEPRAAAPLRRELRLRNIGAVYSDAWDEFSITRVPAERWDVVVYFKEVQPSRVLQVRGG